MKIARIVLLAAVLLSTLAPFSPAVPEMASGGTPLLASLDVCSTQGAGLFSGADADSLVEWTGVPINPGFTGFHRVLDPASHLFLFSSQEERPPKA